MPVATGERLYSRPEFLAAAAAGIAVAQPDLSHAGGISEVRKIAALAEAYDVQLAPHCPLGPIALAACLQVGVRHAQLPDPGAEHRHPLQPGAELLDYVLDKAPLPSSTGYLARPEAPGLGITIDEAAVRAADEHGHAWRNPVWQHEDGSYAEW